MNEGVTEQSPHGPGLCPLLQCSAWRFSVSLSIPADLKVRRMNDAVPWLAKPSCHILSAFWNLLPSLLASSIPTALVKDLFTFPASAFIIFSRTIFAFPLLELWPLGPRGQALQGQSSHVLFAVLGEQTGLFDFSAFSQQVDPLEQTLRSPVSCPLDLELAVGRLKPRPGQGARLVALDEDPFRPCALGNPGGS